MVNRTKLNLSAVILGLTSIIGQIIIIRELIIVFYGNELSLGVILASWLFWVSIGSTVLGRLVNRLKSKEATLSNIQLSLAVFLPLNIFLIRNIKSILNISTGEIIGFIPMFNCSFLSLSLLCMMLGFTFILIARLSAENSKIPSREVGKIYLLEGLGASIGGLLYSFFLIKALTPFQNAFIVGSLNLMISLLFNRNLFQLIYLIGLSTTFIFNWPAHLEKYTRQLQFRPFELVESTDSIYGNITVTKSKTQFSFYENGLLIFTSPDLLTSEESVHYALLEHPAPKDVLLIGGGVSGSLKEILKHPIESLDYVELDPLIIKLAEKYLPLIKDDRVNIIHADGRFFVKSDLAIRGYDVVILDIPDPYTAMLNRFYSIEFFREVKKILAPDGILSFSLTSSENYINQEQAYYLASIYNTLKQEFQDIKILPGDRATFLATNKSDMLTYEADILIKRLRERRISSKFVREYYLPFKLDPLRIKYIEDTLREFTGAKINQDFKPISYFYHMSVWMGLFHSGKGILPYLQKINLNLFILIIVFLFFLGYLIKHLVKFTFKLPVIISIGTTGMSEISFQIIVILTFQFLYGYIYYKIGLILTSFMIGLVLGSFCINRIVQKLQDEKSLYIKTQIAICIYPLLLPAIFTLIAKINITRPDIGNSLQVSFAMLPTIAGFIGGFQFPLANKICLKDSQDVGRTTGLLYGIDIFGACIGGLLVGVILIPVIGIIETCIFLSILNTLILILLTSTRKS
ncbi:MAG: fused MFS/spermidine synthase [Candidatus Omnitrophica bacterium]|nr:fused MFS/spermidine synthase [Candidatus Omnitrophota bacterium]